MIRDSAMTNDQCPMTDDEVHSVAKGAGERLNGLNWLNQLNEVLLGRRRGFEPRNRPTGPTLQERGWQGGLVLLSQTHSPIGHD